MEQGTGPHAARLAAEHRNGSGQRLDYDQDREAGDRRHRVQNEAPGVPVDDGGATQFYMGRPTAGEAGIPGNTDPWQRLLGLLAAGCWYFSIDTPIAFAGIGVTLMRKPSCHQEYTVYVYTPV